MRRTPQTDSKSSCVEGASVEGGVQEIPSSAPPFRRFTGRNCRWLRLTPLPHRSVVKISDSGETADSAIAVRGGRLQRASTTPTRSGDAPNDISVPQPRDFGAATQRTLPFTHCRYFNTAESANAPSATVTTPTISRRPFSGRRRTVRVATGTESKAPPTKGMVRPQLI